MTDSAVRRGVADGACDNLRRVAKYQRWVIFALLMNIVVQAYNLAAFLEL